MHVLGKIILIAVTFAAAIIGYGIPTDANADDPRAKLVSLINNADQLCNDTALIVAKHPTTQGAVDIIFDTVGKQWQNDEKAFQDSLAYDGSEYVPLVDLLVG
jgi:hypothetical protein